MRCMEPTTFRISESMKQLFTRYWFQYQALYVTLSFVTQTRRAIAAANPRAVKTRMEIREQDFSFNDDTQERPLFELVTKDVRTADIFNIMKVREEEEGIIEDVAVSWWQDAVTEEFSKQDIVLLALIVMCALRLLYFVCHVTCKVMRRTIRWYNTDGKQDYGEFELETASVKSGNIKQQLATIRFCHLQFLLVIEKLQREMQDRQNEDTQKLIASLVVLQCKDVKKVTLAEILAIVQTIQAQDVYFTAREIEEHLADIKQDVEDEKVAISVLAQAWEQLQDIYASFHRIQATILRRQMPKKKRKWQLRHHEQSPQEQADCCQRQLVSSTDCTKEVLHELQKLTKELPQGFTADMFTSLGKAIYEKKVAVFPAQLKTRFASQVKKTKPQCLTSIAPISVVCAKSTHNAKVQKKPLEHVDASHADIPRIQTKEANRSRSY